MSKKFAFIGAGSFDFTRKLVRDILSFPAFSDSRIALMDVDRDRLDSITEAVGKIRSQGGYPATVTATTSRKEALEGADGVVCTILAGGVDVWRHDVEIPMEFGVDINVGDTRGPSGIFRYLRTVNPILEIARDVAAYCPDAVFLNYTNPMAMLCRTIQEVCPDLHTTGLCHSVQGTACMLAEWINARESEIAYTCAGINHQAFYTEFLVDGKDAYPLIRKAITEREEIYNEEIVRNEMFLALGYYPTESSGHNSEYNAWFRKRPDLIEKYCLHGTGWNPGAHAFIRDEYLRREKSWRDDINQWLKEDFDLGRGFEYAAYIFNAVLGDGEFFRFNGNIRNFGLIDNLPQGACVEVPVIASRHGFEPVRTGPLPPQLALLCGISSQIEEMVVNASRSGDKEMVYQAICFDPLTSAVLSLREIRSMVDAMFAKNADWLPQFK